MKVNYNGKQVKFDPLLQILQHKDALLLAVKPLKEKFKVDANITAAIMFNILGFYLNFLEDAEQIEFIEAVKKDLADMIDNGLDKFDKAQK
ncbi:MAG: hypothetical protein EBU90_19010 [Proteobacteria bacterium]|nr:hypothetical protein [Pseudomonadota bacterium]NBP15501.1 hypothetical protein [bacterium]